MLEFIIILLILLGVFQGATTAFSLKDDQKKQAQDIKEVTESLKFMGMTQLEDQKKLAMRFFKISTAYTLLFSIPALWFLWFQSSTLGVLASGLLLVLDLVKILGQYREIKKAKSLQTILTTPLASKVLHFVRIVVKAVVIALLLGKVV